MLSELIQKCQDELTTKHDGYVWRFEENLAQVAALQDSACIQLLLPLFNDNAEYDDVMFSIIHTIEIFDHVTYVQAVADHLDSFFHRSPKWATVIHMRILNSTSAFRIFNEYIQTLSQKKKVVVCKILGSLQHKSAFTSKCDALLASIGL